MTLEFIAATIADIAALWKLAAVIALAVVLLVYRTPIAGVLERGGLRVRRRDTEFELPPAPRKADRDAGEKPEEPRAEGEEDALPARVTKASLAGEDDEGTAGDDREEPSLGSVLALLLRGDVERARSLFDEVQRSEQDEITRLRNQASFAAARAAKTDDPVALEELVAVAERDEVAAYARNLLGVVHMETGYPEKAVEAYESALTAASDDDDIARAAEGVARALAALGSEREGIERLEWSLGRITSARAATAVYRAIADLQQERKDWIRRSIALSKAVELSPNDTVLRFALAYSCSEAEFDDAAVLHYEAILDREPNNPGASNNLAISFERLDMPMKSADHYKRSWEQGHTLAASNLAVRYMRAGFGDDADTLLRQAARSEDPHPNVGSNIGHLAAAREEENTKRTSARNAGRERDRFMREYVTARVSQQPRTESVSGEWRTSDNRSVLVSQSDDNIGISWWRNSTEHRASGSFKNRSFDLQVDTREYSVAARW